MSSRRIEHPARQNRMMVAACALLLVGGGIGCVGEIGLPSQDSVGNEGTDRYVGELSGRRPRVTIEFQNVTTGTILLEISLLGRADSRVRLSLLDESGATVDTVEGGLELTLMAHNQAAGIYLARVERVNRDAEFSLRITFPRDSACGDGACDDDEDCGSCADDCGACGPVCGDGSCDSDETCSSCADDCGACGPVCGNGSCDSDETCSSCAADCGACGPVCGDGSCDSDETCSSCADDCGACGPLCGDGRCDSGESCSSCASDCGACGPICGDGRCDSGESCSSCAGDCGTCPTGSGGMIYIDRDGGNDADDGLSPDTAWKNCPGTSAYSGSGSVVAGDTVVFDSNDTWTLTGSPQGLFLVGGVRYVGDEWAADGGSVSGRATLIAGNDFNSNGVVRFRDHPNTETVFKGFEVDVNGMSANGIDINHGFWSLMNGATKRVENVEVHHVYTESSRGEYHYGIAMSNWGGDAGVLENVEILNCSVHDIGRDAIILYPSDDPSSRIGNILVRGCDIYNTGQDPNYGEGHGIVVKGWVYDSTLEFNYVHDVNSSAIFISGPEGNTTQRGADNLRIQHNILTSQDNNGIVRFYKSGDKQVEVVGNIIHNNSQTGGLSLSGNSGALDLVVFNNTFYQTFVDLGGHNSNVNALDLANNIIQYSNNPLRNTSYATSLAANLVTTSDPGFVNSSNLPTGFVFSAGGGLVPNTDGIALGRNCTAVDAGVALGAAYENSINGIPRPQGLEWDVGAYESGHTSSCVALTCNQVAPECGAVSDGCGGTLTCACAPVCGDGSCDIGETCSTCASDCECSSGTTVNASSCSQSSVEQAISQAAVGDTVVVPPGECTWSGFTIDKAIHLKGSGIGATTITRGGVVTVVKQPAGIVRISDFSFVSNGSGNSTLAFRFTGSWQNARPIIFENNDVTTNRSSFISFTMSGGSILANNTWTAGIDDSVLDYIGYSDSSWDEASTMGADDTTGELNHYIEGNTIYGGANQFIDCAGNARCVYRHNDTKYSSFNTHGQHADPAGVRHYEIYENLFRHDQAGADTPEASVIWSLWLRGGTGVVFNNYFDNISGGHWGDHKEIRMTVPVDPNALDFGGSCVGWDYPMPRQIGQSHNGTNTITDPVYFWSNTGTMERSVSIYASEACGLTIDDVFQWGRDAIWEGGAKPGYTAYPYPHPLVGGP